MSRLARTGWAIALALAGAAAVPSAAVAQPLVSGPTVVLDRYEAAPGDRVVLTISGFQGESVVISVCGNEARRGSVDCDMTGSRARETQSDGPVGTDLTITAPPAPCPCIVRVASRDNVQVAVVPMVIIAHPVADVVGSGATTAQPLGVAITANPATAGFGDTVKSSLGGSTTYDLTIRVTNRATFEVPAVALAATFTRGWSDDTRNIDVSDPGSLLPGQTWVETVQVDVPSLTFGDVEWRATVSGQGPSVTVTDTTSSQPILLYLLGAILAIDLLILAWRMIARVRRRDDGDWEPDDNPFVDGPGPDADGEYEYVYVDEPTRADERRDPHLVG